MDTPIEEIKKRIDIVDFIGNFIPLKKAGRNFKANCPFHQEKTPSFIISPDRQIWHCFGACQDGGDVIKFLMKWENLTFYEALRELAEKVGIKLKRVDFEDRAWQKKERLFSLNNLTVEFYHYLLTKHAIGEKAIAYLKSRQLNKNIIKTFDLGYSPSSWDSLFKFLKKKGYGPLEMMEAGVVLKSDRGGFYDRFRKRLIFPLKDVRGNVLGFSGRILDEESEAKYVNTPETLLYHKRETLFGIHLAKEAIKDKNQAIVVEGEFDMISCFQEGVVNTVAVKGSSVTKDQLMLLKRYTKKVALALDADLAGIETTKRAINDAESLDFEIGVVTFDFGKDPDEAIKNDPSLFKKIVEKPIPIYDFIIDLSVKKNKGEDAFAKKNVADEVIPFIANIENPIVQSYYVKKIAGILDVENKAIEFLIKKEKNKRRIRERSSPLIKKPSEKNRLELLQKYVLSLIFQNPNPSSFSEKIFSVIDLNDFSLVAHQKLLERFFHLKGASFTLKQFVASLPKELIPVFDELFLFDVEIFDEDIKDADLTKTLLELKRLSLKKRVKENMGNINEAKKLIDTLSQVEKRLIAL